MDVNEMLDQICKYRIGQLLNLRGQRAFGGTKHQPQLLVVVDRTIVQCYNTHQVHYSCRLHMLDYMGQQATLRDIWAFTEPELVEAGERNDA